MIPAAYRNLLRDPRTRRLLAGLGASSLGDGLSTVTIAWLAVRIAPPDQIGLFVGLAVAAYTLPGVIGALAFGGLLRGRSARAMLLGHCVLRAGCLGGIALLYAAGMLEPVVYLVLLAGSSLMYAWGNAGQYTMLAELGGPDGRMAVNSLASAQVSFATIVGPVLAGVLLGFVGPDVLLAVDAASFAFLAVAAWGAGTARGAVGQPIDAQAAESGFRLLRRPDLLSLTVVTWVFFFLYGPVEVALPVYVAVDLGADAGLLGLYWTTFGVGALAANLITGTIRGRNMRGLTLIIVAGWGACLLPFAFAPVPVTLAAFAIGGLIYGPFIPLTYALFQSSTTAANLPSVLAARSAVVLVSTPVGTAIGGPLVASVGASGTLALSGLATVLLAAGATLLWKSERGGRHRSGIEKPFRAGLNRLDASIQTPGRPEEPAMKIGLTSIYVDDQDKALRFYTEVLGFVKKTDVTQGPYRWLTVASPEDPDGIELQLAKNDSPAAKAYQQALFEQGERAIMFYVDDVQAEHDRAAAAGATFTTPPTKVTGSTIAVLDDTCGNLVQITALDRWG